MSPVTINSTDVSCKLSDFCSILAKFRVLPQAFIKVQSNFVDIRQIGAAAGTCGFADEWTNMAKAN
jgi:hypothetical protein